jgi:DNA topoisomerase VI subunit B
MFEGNWTQAGAGMKSRSFLLKYLRQLAVITPYAQISLAFEPLHKREKDSLKVSTPSPMIHGAHASLMFVCRY